LEVKLDLNLIQWCFSTPPFTEICQLFTNIFC
jgi:hypothetical protein